MVGRELQVLTTPPMKRPDVASAIAPSITSSTIRATSAPAARQKPKYYNSEFRKRDTQRHHLGLYATDAAQRETFVYILLFCGCNDAAGLWERCKENHV